MQCSISFKICVHHYITMYCRYMYVFNLSIYIYIRIQTINEERMLFGFNASAMASSSLHLQTNVETNQVVP